MYKPCSSFSEDKFSLKGFTLVEVMIGVVVVSLAVMPIIGIFGKTAVLTQETESFISAVQIGVSTLKALMNLPFSEIPLGNPLALDRTIGRGNSQVRLNSEIIMNHVRYSPTLSIRYVSRDPGSSNIWFDYKTVPAGPTRRINVYKQLLRLDVTIRWASKVNPARTESIQLTAYKSDLQ